MIVVNNGGDLSQLKLDFSSLPVIFIEADANLGFSKANNLGFKKAEGEIILYLNSDVIFHEPVVNACMDALQKNRDIGAVGCKLLNNDLSLQLSYHDGDRVFSKLWWRNPFCIKWMKGTMKAANSMNSIMRRHQNDHCPNWITGAFIMLNKADIINNNWTWDEAFFMYWEDVELCYRIRKSGKKILYLAQPTLIHLGGGGTEVSINRFSWLEDSKLIFLKKQSKFKHWLYLRLVKLELKLEYWFLKDKMDVLAKPNLYLQKELDYYGIK